MIYYMLLRKLNRWFQALILSYSQRLCKMQRCHITTEFVRTKQLCESSVYERLNEWYLSPPHAAGSSQTALKSYPFPALYLLATHGSLQIHKEVFPPTPLFLAL